VINAVDGMEDCNAGLIDVNTAQRFSARTTYNYSHDPQSREVDVFNHDHQGQQPRRPYEFKASQNQLNRPGTFYPFLGRGLHWLYASVCGCGDEPSAISRD
jgi:hypothetical protein